MGSNCLKISYFVKALRFVSGAFFALFCVCVLIVQKGARSSSMEAKTRFEKSVTYSKSFQMFQTLKVKIWQSTFMTPQSIFVRDCWLFWDFTLIQPRKSSEKIHLILLGVIVWLTVITHIISLMHVKSISVVFNIPCGQVPGMLLEHWSWWWWLLLYSASPRSRADLLRSHVILHEWLAFYSAFLNIHRSGVLTALEWLVPHETAAVSAQSMT